MDKISFDFKNRTALVTGGAQGFGLDIAKRFLKSGAKVIIWDIDSKMIEQAIKELNSPNLAHLTTTHSLHIHFFFESTRHAAGRLLSLARCHRGGSPKNFSECAVFTARRARHASPEQKQRSRAAAARLALRELGK